MPTILDRRVWGGTPQARAAYEYARRGWPVLPCEPYGKLPLTRRGYHDATADLDRVATWWRAQPWANVAIVPARAVVDDGRTLLVLDCDGPAGFDAARALSVPYDTARVTTGRPEGGEHRYFTVPAGVQIGNRALAPALDVRHAAGYVLVPRSVHPSGAAYRWATAPAWTPGAVLPLPPALLERLAAAPVAAARTNASQHATAGDNLAATDYFSRPRSTPEARTWRRVKRYLAKVPTELADGRKTVGYRLAAALVHDFALGPHDAWAVLKAWNTDNRPPLPRDALAGLLHNAAKYGKGSGRGSARGGT